MRAGDEIEVKCDDAEFRKVNAKVEKVIRRESDLLI
jgi:hypothetical protein